MIQKTFRAEALARLQRATLAECGFAERLVVFWSNHFCISANKGGLARMWAGSFEREAIRPHVLGRFADMLKAVEQHPAMLFFLDNQQSLGPDSARRHQPPARPERKSRARDHGAAYARRERRLHPGRRHLARAHHHGLDLCRPAGRLGTPGSFVFNANAHEPGAQRVLGKIYEANGLAQGEAVLADIARHPSTAKFIATKFARHFVADDPPPALVARAAGRLHQNRRRSAALANALIDADEAWTAPLTKMRSPYEYLVATGRICWRACPMIPAAISAGSICSASRLWSPAGPNGFPDTNAAWAAPEGMKLRLDIAAQVASRLPDSARSARSARARRGGRGLGGNTTHHRARGIAAAGDGAAADVAGISEEMTMDVL